MEIERQKQWYRNRFNRHTLIHAAPWLNDWSTHTSIYDTTSIYAGYVRSCKRSTITFKKHRTLQCYLYIRSNTKTQIISGIISSEWQIDRPLLLSNLKNCRCSTPEKIHLRPWTLPVADAFSFKCPVYIQKIRHNKNCTRLPSFVYLYTGAWHHHKDVLINVPSFIKQLHVHV